MDYSLLKQLLNQAIYDIREFVPDGYSDMRPPDFNKLDGYETCMNAAMAGLPPDSTHEKIRASRASRLGKSILGHDTIVSARQYAAREMLPPLGEL